jgi:streptomycin 6-kinase
MSLFEDTILSIYKDKGKAWLADLPKIVTEAAQRYGLYDLNPVSNLSYNYVLSGIQNGQPIILKVGLDGDGLKREAAALKAFSGFGAIKVLGQSDGLLLLERAVPGISLKSSPKEALPIACAVMKKLHQAPIPKGFPFPCMKDWLAILDQEWDIPVPYLAKARKLRDHLLATSVESILLHGDLHHDNILHNGSEWVVIDPKGVIGSPLNEIWAFIMDREKDTEYVAEFFNFEVSCVRQWYFVHLILASLWNIEDGVTPNLFLDLAEKAYPTV